MQYEEAVYSGEVRKNHSLLFSGRELDILHPDSDVQWERELLSEKTLGLGDRKLPLTWRRERWRAYETVQKTRTAAEAKTLLEEKLRKNAENLLSPYGTIEDIQIRYEVYANSVPRRCGNYHGGKNRGEKAEHRNRKSERRKGAGKRE